MFGATFEQVVDIAWDIEVVRSQEQVEREAKRYRGSGIFGCVPSGGKFHHDRGRPYRHAQTARPVHRGAASGHGFHSSHQGHSSLGALLTQSSSHVPSAHGSSMSGHSSRYPDSRGFLQSLVAGRG